MVRVRVKVRVKVRGRGRVGVRVRGRAGAAVARLVVRGDVGLVAGLTQPGRGDNKVTCLPPHVAGARRDRGRCSTTLTSHYFNVYYWP